MVLSRMDLREKVPVNIVRWANLELTMNELFNNFEAWEKRDAEFVNKFFEQPYFKWEESLIGKLINVKDDIKFEDIKDEWINLAVLRYNRWTREFKECLDKIDHDPLKEEFINEIHDRLFASIWTVAPYVTDFAVNCGVTAWDTDVLWYFQKVVNYLEGKESETGWRKAVEILKDITITNENLNWRLPTGLEITPTSELRDPALPANTKNAFDNLLSFEIWKEADRTIDIAKDFSNNLQKLLTNFLPAINTVVWESDEYRYDEGKLWFVYEWDLRAIRDNTALTEEEKNKQINDLKRRYYIRYLKLKNVKIWNALELLYNNDFDYSKLDRNTLKDYFDKVADIRLKMLFDKWMNAFIKLNWWNVDDFKNFYKNLVDVDPNNPTLNITLSDVNIPWATPPVWPINIPIQKKLVEWKNEWLKNDIEQFWKNASKSFDAFPMEFKIKKSDIEWLPITIEDRTKLLNLLSKFDVWDEYEIKWENIWILIYLFFVMNSNLPITEMDPEQQKEVEKLFGQAKNQKVWPKDKNTENNNEWSEVYSPDKFKEEIEKYWSGTKFENWSEIWLPMGKSELPGWWHQRMKIKISKIDMAAWTFTGTVFWWELKFGNKLEWKSREFKMNKKFIEDLKGITEKASANEKKLRLLPNPDNVDFDSYKNGLSNKLWTSTFSFPPASTTWDGHKFMQKIKKDWKENEVEVKYFWAPLDDKSIYKIEYNPIRKSFTVSSTFNWDEKWKDWKSEKKRFSYKRDMDWNNFLIFFTQKWLIPQTEEQAKDAVTRQDNEFKMENWWHRKLNWFSINNVKSVFKTLKWNIKKKIDDYNNAQNQKLEDILVWDWWLYSWLANVFWFIPSMKQGLWELEQEYYNERDNRTWKKIEYYLKMFQADPDFWTTFDQVPPHAKIQWWKSLELIVLNRVKNAKDRMWDPGIYQAAALLLANFEKWWSPYRGLAAKENTWLWVTALLWKAHYEQFMRDKAKLIAARDNAEKSGSWDKKWLNETLAACEMKYIINNVRWSYRWLIEWSYEDRWIPWEDDTNYVDNPAKRLLSDQFASKLETAYNGRFNKNSVNDKYNKFQNNNSFDEIENEFWKTSSTRYQIWQAALRRMIDLAVTDDLKKRMKKHFLTYLLCWALDINCDPGLKKQVYEWAKPMMFVPWLLVKEAWVAENIAILLDDIEPRWDFSANITKYFHRNDQLDGWTDFKWLQKELNAWLTDDKMNQLDDYFSKLPTKDISGYPEPKHTIIENFQKAMSDSKRDEGDRWILENAEVVSNWLLSSGEVVEKRIKIQNWKFNGKNIDEDNNMRDFRKNVTADINSRDVNDPREVAFVLEKFINRFWIDNQQIYTRIKTADYWDNNRGYFAWPYESIDLNMWNIWDKEIDSILWYAFQWNARRSRWLWCDRLPDELYDTLDTFGKFFSKAFYAKTLLNNYVVENGFKPKNKGVNPLFMSSRNVYDQVFAWDSESQYFINNIDTPDDDLYSSDPDKVRKAKDKTRRSLLKSSDFINSDIANIEKKLKSNLSWTSTLFKTVTSSRLETARARYFSNAA